MNNNNTITLLLIEDNSGDARLIEEMLKSTRNYDFEIIWEKTLKGGIERVNSEENQIDIILLDLSLPDSSGLVTFEKILLSVQNIPVIVLSGLSDESIALQAVKNGAQDYLVKGQINDYLLSKAIIYAQERHRSDFERKRLMDQLANAQKMAALGKLAGGVAHEINNPLTSILATAQLLLEDDENITGAIREDMEQLVESAKRIKDTVKNFLGFAKTREFNVYENDINELIENAINLVGRGQFGDIEINRKFDLSISQIKISRYQIKEVFVNILSNAVQSMNGKGELTITTSSDDEHIIASFKDTGIGIHKDDIDKIFEPYFTTKQQKGTGLGLSTSMLIITQHNGKIVVKSEGEDKGAEFIVYIPKEI